MSSQHHNVKKIATAVPAIAAQRHPVGRGLIEPALQEHGPPQKRAIRMAVSTRNVSILLCGNYSLLC